MDYKNELKKFKIDTSQQAIVGISVTEKQIIEKLHSFATRDELIGVDRKKIYDIFEQYCRDTNFPVASRIAVGRIVCKEFNLVKKKVRRGKDVIWIYIDKK